MSPRCACRAAPLAPGTVLHHRYHLLATLGAGVSGRVYLARDVVAGDGEGSEKDGGPPRRVAIKVFERRDCADLQFCREVDHLRRLNAADPGAEFVPRLLDTFLARDGRPCIAMEYLAGRTLKQLVREAAPPGGLDLDTIRSGGARPAPHFPGTPPLLTARARPCAARSCAASSARLRSCRPPRRAASSTPT